MALCGKHVDAVQRKALPDTVMNGRKAFQYVYHVIQHGMNNEARRKTLGRTARQEKDAAAEAAREAKAQKKAEEAAAKDEDVSYAGSEGVPASVAAEKRRERRIFVDEDATEAGRKFEQKKNLPNVHQGLHYPKTLSQYGSGPLINVDRGEVKHGEYKADIRSTNRREPAATLISRERDRLSIAMAFSVTDSQEDKAAIDRIRGLTVGSVPTMDLVSLVKQFCPNLTASCNPFLRRGAQEEEEDAFSHLTLEGTETHKQPLLRLGLSAAWIESLQDPLLRVDRPYDMDPSDKFLVLLQAAYKQDYACSGIVWNREHKLRWSRMVSWKDP